MARLRDDLDEIRESLMGDFTDEELELAIIWSQAQLRVLTAIQDNPEIRDKQMIADMIDLDAKALRVIQQKGENHFTLEEIDALVLRDRARVNQDGIDAYEKAIEDEHVAELEAMAQEQLEGEK